VRTVFMFSGQGSQYFQMGRELFDRVDVFRDWMLRLDDIVQDLCSTSVVKVLYSAENNKASTFDRTLLTHPAIFMVEYALAQTLLCNGIEPDSVLGVSLGSFAAAAISGFLTVEDALSAVVRQALILEEYCREPGVMAAILAEPALLSQRALGQHCQLAGVNFSSHFVVAARKAEWPAIEAHLTRLGISFQRLPVSYAFHSQWIDPAQGPFELFMDSIVFKRGSVPLICSTYAQELVALPRGYFWRVIRQPMRFQDSIASLEQRAAHRYVDVGPAGTLATFLKYSLTKSSTSAVHSILTPFGYDLRNMAVIIGSREGRAPARGI
jgi:bacillaene synthase trans-acting acyltransferase